MVVDEATVVPGWHATYSVVAQGTIQIMHHFWSVQLSPPADASHLQHDKARLINDV